MKSKVLLVLLAFSIAVTPVGLAGTDKEMVKGDPIEGGVNNP